ncbi:MAG: hypothetical protein WAL50_17060 [Kineosporiaceae bacterium]
MSTMPPWGTPPSPDPVPSSSPGRPGPPTSVYLLVVEQQTGSGESMVWRVDPDPLPVQPGSSRQQAQDAALHLARTFRPHHPWNQGERVVLRLTPDSYLVIVPGATKTFHFRVSVAELMP